MRKISFVNCTAYFTVASLLGAGFTAGYLYLNKPVSPVKQNLPVISFENAELYRSTIISSKNPFVTKASSVSGNKASLNRPGVPQISDAEKIEVMGILPPDTCILKKGNITRTVKVNEKNEIGNVSDITSKGVYVDGVFYAIK